MCGIVGYTGARPARPLLLDGLTALEYRGYDSAGIATGTRDGAIETVRSVGNLQALRAAVAERVPAGAGGLAVDDEPVAGIGHTRWATHGGVTEANAHPHTDTTLDQLYTWLSRHSAPEPAPAAAPEPATKQPKQAAKQHRKSPRKQKNKR